MPVIDVTDLEYDDSLTGPHHGGAISSPLTSGTPNNLFANINTADCNTGKTYYACIYVHNKNATGTWYNAKAWVDATPAQGSTAIGLDSAAVGATAVSTTPNATTAPTPTVTFTTPTDKTSGLSIGDIPATAYKAIWIRLTIPAGATSNPADLISIRVEGDTDNTPVSGAVVDGGVPGTTFTATLDGGAPSTTYGSTADGGTP